MFEALAATRFAHFAAICLLFGAAAFPFYALERGEAAPRLRRVVLACSVAALVAGVLELMAMAGSMGDSWQSAFDPGILGSAVTDTQFGRVWIARLALAIVALGLCARRRPGRDGAMLAVSAVLLASAALTGHSAIPGDSLGMAHQVADALHLLAAGWWIGGLLALLLVAHRLGERAPLVLARFSRIGYAAVALIVATGVLKSLILISPLSTLVTSTYGRVLLLKLALFCAMGLLAMSNRFQVTPALAAGADPARSIARLRKQVALEFGLAVLVLAVVGVLGAMAPPVSE